MEQTEAEAKASDVRSVLVVELFVGQVWQAGRWWGSAAEEGGVRSDGDGRRSVVGRVPSLAAAAAAANDAALIGLEEPKDEA
jgi:hypothetical protein